MTSAFLVDVVRWAAAAAQRQFAAPASLAHRVLREISQVEAPYGVVVEVSREEARGHDLVRLSHRLTRADGRDVLVEIGAESTPSIRVQAAPGPAPVELVDTRGHATVHRSPVVHVGKTSSVRWSGPLEAYIALPPAVLWRGGRLVADHRLRHHDNLKVEGQTWLIILPTDERARRAPGAREAPPASLAASGEELLTRGDEHAVAPTAQARQR